MLEGYSGFECQQAKSRAAGVVSSVFLTDVSQGEERGGGIMENRTGSNQQVSEVRWPRRELE